MISSEYGENATMVLDKLKTLNFAVFSVTSQNEDGETVTSTKLVQKINGEYEILNFDSYATFKPIRELYASNPQFYAPISDYIQSLILGNTTPEIAIKAYEFLSQSGLDDISADLVNKMRNLIEQHLTDRLLKENEC